MTVPIGDTEDVVTFDWHSVQELWPVPVSNVEEATSGEDTTLAVQLAAGDTASSADTGIAVTTSVSSDSATGLETAFLELASSNGDAAAAIDTQALGSVVSDTAITIDATSLHVNVPDGDLATVDDAAYVSRNDPPSGYAIADNFLIVHNNFEGGIASVQGGPHIGVLNSGDTSGSAFDSVKFTWDDTDADWSFGFALYSDWESYHGSICGEFRLFQTSGHNILVDTYCAWNAALFGARSELYTRLYFKTWIGDLRQIDIAIVEWTDRESGCATRLVVDTANQLSLVSYDSEENLLGEVSIGTVDADIWNRIEVHIRFSPMAGNGIDGAISEAYIYVGDSSVPIANGAGLYANSEVERCDQVRIGLFSFEHGGGVLVPASPQFPSVGFIGWFWMDDVAVTDVDWIGPAENVVFDVDSAVANENRPSVYVAGTIEKTSGETTSAVDIGMGASQRAAMDNATTVESAFAETAAERLVMASETATVDEFGVYERA